MSTLEVQKSAAETKALLRDYKCSASSKMGDMRESGGDHFYGAWHGGAKAAGGGAGGAVQQPQQAIASLAAGRPANVAPHQVIQTLQAAPAGGAPINLTQLSVAGRPVFGNSLGIPRAQMPQVPSNRLDDYFKDLQSRGVAVEPGKVDPRTLKPVQNEVNAAKSATWIDTLARGESPKPVMISKDGYVIDGHHQWGGSMAYAIEHGAYNMPVIRVDLPARQLLGDVSRWTDAQGLARKTLTEADVNVVDGIILRD